MLDSQCHSESRETLAVTWFVLWLLFCTVAANTYSLRLDNFLNFLADFSVWVFLMCVYTYTIHTYVHDICTYVHTCTLKLENKYVCCRLSYRRTVFYASCCVITLHGSNGMVIDTFVWVHPALICTIHAPPFSMCRSVASLPGNRTLPPSSFSQSLPPPHQPTRQPRMSQPTLWMATLLPWSPSHLQARVSYLCSM